MTATTPGTDGHSTGLRHWRWRWLAGGAVLFLIGLAWFLNAGTALIATEPPTIADAIIVLGGNAPDRLVHAEELRAAGFATLLVVSDEPVHTHGLETTWYALHEAGVAAPDIPDADLVVVTDPPPDSTIEEARRDGDLMVARRLHSALLVTDAFHSHRALLLFRAAFAHRGLNVRSTPVDNGADLAQWWRHPLAAREVTEEWAKLIYYLVQGAYW